MERSWLRLAPKWSGAGFGERLDFDLGLSKKNITFLNLKVIFVLV
jgi:hypothetical protein